MTKLFPDELKRKCKKVCSSTATLAEIERFQQQRLQAVDFIDQRELSQTRNQILAKIRRRKNGTFSR